MTHNHHDSLILGFIFSINRKMFRVILLPHSSEQHWNHTMCHEHTSWVAVTLLTPSQPTEVHHKQEEQSLTQSLFVLLNAASFFLDVEGPLFAHFRKAARLLETKVSPFHSTIICHKAHILQRHPALPSSRLSQTAYNWISRTVGAQRWSTKEKVPGLKVVCSLENPLFTMSDMI